MAKLDKRTRAALPDTAFAVPDKRRLPINDEHHTILAWSMVDQMTTLSNDERRVARERILAKAAELNIDTKDWNSLKSVSLECMSLNIEAGDHPNRMPFSGVMTRVDEPSDGAPGGSGGRRVILTADAANAALPSLLGMGVNFASSFDGHDVKNKIGIITAADVVGSDLRIEGFIYAADFPETADLIQEMKDVLGFSFEAQRVRVEDPSADVLRISELTFTGAAILLKSKAAYQNTSIAASADNGDLDMTKEELEAILAAALKPVTDRLAVVEAGASAITEHLANANKIKAQVEPIAADLERQATAAEAAGLVAHAAHLRKMAQDMRTEAAAGKLPSLAPVAATVPAKPEVTDVAAQIAAAVDAALKPVKDELASTKTQLEDAKNNRRLQASAPERKTLPGVVTSLMSRAGIAMPEEGKKLTIGEVDKLMASANLTMQQRLMVKGGLDRAGVLV